jgi:di/tricarboxylate transporter
MTSLVFGRCNSYAVFFSKWMSGPVGGILVSITASYFGMKVEMAKTLGLCVFMIMWWLNAPVRMGITGLLPIVFLPLLGVCSGVIVSKEYFSDSVVICWGTLLIATAVEKYKLHNRFATRLLNITERYGINGILFGFVFITGFLSMWLSNTATAAMMAPMSNAVFTKLRGDAKRTDRESGLEDDFDFEHRTLHTVHRSAVNRRISLERPSPRRYSEETLRSAATAVDLSIAFAASLGGMATLTGTGSNIVLQGTLLALFGGDGAVSFLGWMSLFAPLALFNLLGLWLVLVCCFTINSERDDDASTDRLRSFSSEVLSTSPLHTISSDTLSHSSFLNSNSKDSSSHRRDADSGSHRRDAGQRDTEAPLSYPQKVVVSLHPIYCAISFLSQMLVFCAMVALWMTRDPPGGWGW